ncbi:unnamed protein product (macronuclear) [Paramecium tetraurelia]|uniref:Uncharacterized protein n=1 Tax=Paramecium tetraurelia TaxID=5888 RepID=A0EAB7_PARTE|nr:uncharacterized protein GSPATT00024966001 [Paramecium tetraurelia]CAK92234.1 unnamed protein product [Paramecium tetraurelia]|eukprot:XP_001459631.1 hypothetical protein (macronuclear) [Paramecium tetraurelia strain d4-2]
MNQYQKIGSYSNNRFDNKQNLQQQTFKDSQIQAQAQAEIQFYIYSDLQNLINLIYSREAVLEYFKNDPNHSMITQSNNKLILQLNLSNAIHIDQQQIYKEQPQLFEFLQKERNKAYKILEKIIDNNDQLQNDHQKNDDVIPKYLKEYKQQYAKQEFKWESFPLQKTNQVAKFDEGVLQKMISSIQNVDNQIEQIRMNKSYRVPDQNEIQLKANDYYKMTQALLKENFPIKNPQVNQMKKQEIINIGGQSNVAQVQNLNQKTPSSNCDEYSKLNNQQDKRICEKEKLIDFINCLSQCNHIPLFKQPFHIRTHFSEVVFWDKYDEKIKQIKWAINFEKQHLLFQLLCLHNYFNLFMEYQKQIKGPQTRQIDMEIVKTLVNNDMKQKKEGKPYISNLIGFMYCCKDQIEISGYPNQKQHTTNPSNNAKKTGTMQNQQINQGYDEDQIYKFYEIFCSQLQNEINQQKR